jgi:uncharacterized protein YndB with AHSA1/START domain
MAANVIELQRTETELPTRVVFVRVIKAKRERVFDALTRPEIIRQWFAPSDRTVEQVTNEPKVDGDYLISLGAGGELTPPERRHPISVSGRYTKVQPHDLLQFTWRGSWQPEEESLVSFTLKDVEGDTELTLVHEGLVKEGSLATATRGWTSGLGNLVNAVSQTE